MNTSLPLGLRQVGADKNKVAFNIYVAHGLYYYKTSFYGLVEYYERLQAHDKEALENWWAKAQNQLLTQGKLNTVTSIWSKAITISEEETSRVKLLDTLPDMTQEFAKLISLYIDFCKKVPASTDPFLNGAQSKLKDSFASPSSVGHPYEICALLFYHPITNVLRWGIPTQTVSKATVNWDISDNRKILFFDGEQNTLAQLNSKGWIKIGTSHSHNTISCTWSGVDYLNLCGSPKEAKPLGLHLLIYGIKNFKDPNNVSMEWLLSASSNGRWCHLIDSTGKKASPEALTKIISPEKMPETITYSAAVNTVVTIASPVITPTPVRSPVLPHAKTAKPSFVKPKSSKESDLTFISGWIAQLLNYAYLNLSDVNPLALFEALMEESDIFEEGYTLYTEKFKESTFSPPLDFDDPDLPLSYFLDEPSSEDFYDPFFYSQV